MVPIDDNMTLWAPTLRDRWPALQVLLLDSTDSTNNWMHRHRDLVQRGPALVVSDSQTAGRGSGTNHWESAPGCNLTFSLLMCPATLPARRMWALSEAMSLAVCLGLEQTMAGLGRARDGRFAIKWPNDVYHADGKVCGMLIENELQARLVDRSVMGVGINVNQTQFVSDAPNPLSLAQIAGTHVSRLQVMATVLSCAADCLALVERGEYDRLHALYLSRVYRWHEWHSFVDAEGTREGSITDVRPDGHLVITDREGQERTYAFGEIKYII